MKGKGKDKKLRRAYQLGFNYEKEYGGCAQCTIAAIQDVLELKNDDVFKAATGIAGGIGLVGKGVCGSLIGGAMMLGYKFGREYSNFEDPENMRFATYRLVEELYDKFITEYGSCYCHDIQTKVFGRAYNLRNEKELFQFLEDGGHIDKCPDVVGKGAQWAVEITLNEEERLKADKPSRLGS